MPPSITHTRKWDYSDILTIRINPKEIKHDNIKNILKELYPKILKYLFILKRINKRQKKDDLVIVNKLAVRTMFYWEYYIDIDIVSEDTDKNLKIFCKIIYKKLNNLLFDEISNQEKIRKCLSL